MRGARRTGAAAIGAVVLVAAGVWALWPDAGSSDDGAGARTPAEAVRAFFEARRRGDCDELAALASNAGGDFAESCRQVVEDYRPELTHLGAVDVVSENDDEAIVEVGIDPDRETDGLVVHSDGSGPLVTERRDTAVAYERGRLVRTDGAWRVVIDDRFFAVGLSPEQTLWRYFGRHGDGDCAAALDYLSRDARPMGPAREAAVARCEAVRRDLPADEERPMPTSIDRRSGGGSGDDEVTLTVRWPRTNLLGMAPPDDTVTLLREGTRWKLAAIPQVTRVVELSATLPQHEAPMRSLLYPDWSHTVNDYSSFAQLLPHGPAEDAARRRDAGFRGGVIYQNDGWSELPSSVEWLDRDLSPVSELLVYAFADAEGAAGYADQLTASVADLGTPTNPATPIDGVTGGRVIPCPRGAGECDPHDVMAIGRADRYVVAVRLFYREDEVAPADVSARASRLLTEQLARVTVAS